MNLKFDVNKNFTVMGLFWLPEKPENKISGELSYDASNGVSVKFVSDFQKASFLATDEIPYLLGDCSEIGEITLIQCHVTSFSIAAIYEKKYSVLYAITNIHYNENENVFNSIEFHFDELNSFCTQNEGICIKNDTPVLESFLDENTRLSIYEGCKDAFAVSNTLYMWSDVEKNESFREYREKLEGVILTKPFLIISLQKKGLSFSESLQKAHHIEKIFRFFMLTPVYTTYFSLTSAQGKHFLLRKPVGERKKNSCFFHFLPVNINNVRENFSEIWKKWNDVLEDTKCNVLITDKFFNGNPFGYMSFGIIISTINDWQQKYGTDKKHKTLCEKFLEESLCEKNEFTDNVKSYFKNALQTEDFHEISEILSDLRNALLHEKKQNSKMKKIAAEIFKSDAAIRNLSEMLFLILTRDVWKHIGVRLTSQTDHHLTRYFPNWQNIAF